MVAIDGTEAAPEAVERAATAIAEELERYGLLLVHDSSLPSATATVAGEPVGGSWWAHPLAHCIYGALESLDDRVATLKLVAGKDTLIAPRLWAALAAIGCSRSAWQLDGLPAPARSLLDEVDRADGPRAVAKDERPAAKQLEQRLLVVGASVHMPSGHHAKQLSSWSAWAESHGVARADLPSPADAVAQLTVAVSEWPPTRRRLFPW